jgi:hypothetical protein
MVSIVARRPADHESAARIVTGVSPGDRPPVPTASVPTARVRLFRLRTPVPRPTRCPARGRTGRITRVTIRRLAAAGFSLLAALALGATGCGTESAQSGQWVPAPTPANAKESLAQAAKRTAGTSAKVDIQEGPTMALVGLLDGSGKRARFTLTSTDEELPMKADLLLLGTDLYLKTDALAPIGIDPVKWTHFDLKRAPSGSVFTFTVDDFDPAHTVQLLNAAGTVQRVGDRGYKGTIDLTKVPDASSLSEQQLTALGAKAKSVPFRATVDSQGRLVTLDIDLPAAGSEPAQKVTTAYTDFGTPVEVTKPGADEVTEAQEGAYTVLGS